MCVDFPLRFQSQVNTHGMAVIKAVKAQQAKSNCWGVRLVPAFDVSWTEKGVSRTVASPAEE